MEESTLRGRMIRGGAAMAVSAGLLLALSVHRRRRRAGRGGGLEAKVAAGRGQMTCPFSGGSDFVVETAAHLPLEPLDRFQDWEEAGLPLAARWLAAGMSGQDAPGVLRAALRRLRSGKHFLVEEENRLAEELRLKAKALDDPARRPLVFVAEPDSLEAQRECLELFVSYLPQRYPQLYSYSRGSSEGNGDGSITVKPLQQTFVLRDWAHAPLELCERLVQEDLILMREDQGPKDAPAEQEAAAETATRSYAMAAAAVVFSFNELAAKLGKPAELIHAPVPGFERHIRRTVNSTFTNLKPERPMWRNNWGIAPSGSLDEPLYGSSEAHQQRRFAAADGVSVEEVKAKFLKVEYQTIRRLPRSGYLLFTVKTMADPMHSLQKVPDAAACLAASIRGMSPAMRVYKGIEDDSTCDAVLSYLDSIVHRRLQQQ